MTHLIICGLPASGKTTMGRRLATSLQWTFIDTDTLIQETYVEKTFSCRDIYCKEGPIFFRELEKQVIRHLKPSSRSVIACGGGALEAEENLSRLKLLGKLIYMHVPLPLLWDRLLQRGIPAYLNKENPRKHFEEIAQARIPLYQKAADVIIEGQSPHLLHLLEGVAHGQQYIRNPL